MERAIDRAWLETMADFLAFRGPDGVESLGFRQRWHLPHAATHLGEERWHGRRSQVGTLHLDRRGHSG